MSVGNICVCLGISLVLDKADANQVARLVVGVNGWGGWGG